MFKYITAIKRAFRDQHGFKPVGGTEHEPLLNVPDGEYLCNIDGKKDLVKIINGGINCCNFQEEQS